MTTTNVPPPVLGPTGFIIPTDAEILAGVQADINAAFGGNVNPALNTPQGQLATSEAAIIANTDSTFLYYTTQVDPAYATGRMQDAIARIYFLERLPAISTVVSCVCTGLAGVTIQSGALAADTSGNIYTCTGGGTIPTGGTITLSFSNLQTGPIACPANTLTSIYQAIPGWDTINNPYDGVIGQNVEGRGAFEARRAASVAKNSIGSLPSVLGSVLAVTGVIDAYVTENYTATTVVNGDYTLAPNSLYVAVVGGANADIAKAIWSKKAPGCGYNGNTSVTVYDSSSGYSPPYPSYNVKFEIPNPLLIYFAVKLSNNSFIPSNSNTLIQNAIIGAFAGTDGGPRTRIAGNVLASRFYAPIAALGPWAQIESIFLGSTNTNIGAVVTGSISTTNFTVTSIASGALAVGQVLSDSAGNILANTRIVSQTSGPSGGIGVYVVNNSQTFASQAVSAILYNAIFTASISGTTMTVTSVVGGIGPLVVGQILTGAETSLVEGTQILGQVSGSAGGTGVYTVNYTQTVASEVMNAIVAGAFNVQAFIDQVPVTSATAIIVTTT